MTREQAINYLFYSGFSEEQINTIEQAFKQEPILDKIRAEIEQHRYGLVNDGLDIALNIIDKYKAESVTENGVRQ